MGPSRAKQGQKVPNRVKWGQTGSNGAKKGGKNLKVPNVAKRAKRGQTRPNGSYGADFLHAHISLCLATQALRQKLAELCRFC